MIFIQLLLLFTFILSPKIVKLSVFCSKYEPHYEADDREIVYIRFVVSIFYTYMLYIYVYNTHIGFIQVQLNLSVVMGYEL